MYFMTYKSSFSTPLKCTMKITFAFTSPMLFKCSTCPHPGYVTARSVAKDPVPHVELFRRALFGLIVLPPFGLKSAPLNWRVPHR
jgi:hypothetical protein